jgi:predicted O-methyltransferase YrrM
VVSLDHDKHWLEMTARRLESVGLRHYVRLVHAPLQQQHVGGRQCLTYSAGPALLADGEAFDFLFIDGPPASVGRASCLPLVVSRLAGGATLLLDDAYRSGEQAAWREWRRQYGGSMAASRMLLTDRGLAVARWRGQAAAVFTQRVAR